MVRYEVTAELESTLSEAYQTYMCQKHIPEIVATGCFVYVHFDRATPTRFRASYHAASQADFDRYLNDYAPHYRQDFQTHFPSGATLSREVWTEIQAWGE